MVHLLLGDGFEEAEALVTADVLRRGGVELQLLGLGKIRAQGSHGVTVVCDNEVEKISLADGDMVVAPGGMGGVSAIEQNQAAVSLIREAAENETTWLAAICAAPALLARLGVIGAGNRAVCYPGMEGALTEAGAEACMDQSTVTDGRLITGRGPGSAFDFGLTILAALKGIQTAESVRGDLHYSK